MTYYNGHWFPTSVAEPLVAQEIREQNNTLSYHKPVSHYEKCDLKTFGIHSNELINAKYYYDLSTTWWTCRATGKLVDKTTLLKIE